MRDLRGQDLKKVEPPATAEERDFVKRSERFVDREFVDEIGHDPKGAKARITPLPGSDFAGLARSGPDDDPG